MSQDPNLVLPKFHADLVTTKGEWEASQLALLEDERMDCFLVESCSLTPELSGLI